LKLRILFSFFLVTFFSNCSNDNDANEIHPIVGEWNLVETKTGFGANSTFYNFGDVIYRFNNEGSLEIESNIPEFDSQTLDYEIVFECVFIDCFGEEEPSDILIIDDSREPVLFLDESNLVFGTNNIGDGTDYFFERVP